MTLDALNVIGTIEISCEADWIAIQHSSAIAHLQADLPERDSADGEDTWSVERPGDFPEGQPDLETSAMQANLSRLLDQLESESQALRARTVRSRA